MTVALTRYLSDMHLGRVNPQALNFDIDVPSRRAEFDIPTLLDDQVVDADDVRLPMRWRSGAAESDLQGDGAGAGAVSGAGAEAGCDAARGAAAESDEARRYGRIVSRAVPALWSRLQMEGDAPTDCAGAGEL